MTVIGISRSVTLIETRDSLRLRRQSGESHGSQFRLLCEEVKLQALRRAIELQHRESSIRPSASTPASSPRSRNASRRCLGVLHFQAARYADVLRCLDGRVRVNPTDVVAMTNLARLEGRLHLREDALAHFDRAIALNPDFADAHLSLGEILRELGRLEDARASLAMASALRPKHAGTLLMFGVTLRELGRLPEALAVFDTALVLEPAFAAAQQQPRHRVARLETS